MVDYPLMKYVLAPRHSCMKFFWQIHHELNIYMSDLISADTELPRAFTSNVVRAVIVKDNTEFVAWSDFSVGFPLAVRQRRVLWDQYVNSSAGTDVPN
jgi:hypothetical protein